MHNRLKENLFKLQRCDDITNNRKHVELRKYA